MSEKIWHVVTHKSWTDQGRIEAPADELIWTVSRDPTWPGWETDSGCPRYGLCKADAEFLAQAANEKIARDGG